MKLDFSKIRYGGQRIQTPHEAVASPDADIILEATSHASPVHIREQPVGSYSIKVVDLNWWRVTLDNPSTRYEGRHGEQRGAVTMKSRSVAINCEIYAPTTEGLEKARDALLSIYAPPAIPSIEDQGFRKFLFEETDGSKWFFYAQLIERLPTFTDEIWQRKIVPVNIRLVSNGDARIFSEETFEVDIDSGFVAGLSVGENADPFGVQNLGAYQGGTTVDFTSKWVSPTKVTIEVDENSPAESRQLVNPKIINVATGELFSVNYTLKEGEVLEIDGFENTIRVNGELKQNLGTKDSDFINLVKGANRIVVFDDQHPYIFGDIGKFKIEYRKVKI